MGAEAEWVLGILTIKHCDNKKKELIVEETKSQVDGNAKAKVII